MDYNVAIDGRGMYSSELVDEILRDRHLEQWYPKTFLKPRDIISSPEMMQNVDKAYNIVSQNVFFGNKIGILFDVDTDGICAGSTMTMYLNDCGIEPKIFINRGKVHGLVKDEPYWDEVTKLDLLIIVDSLNNEYDTYEELHNKGVNIIVLDHHDIKLADTDSFVLVSSQQGNYFNPELSGAGVVWQFCRYYDQQNNTHYADKYVSLVAIGIVADDMNMTQIENRSIVYKGLQSENYSQIPAIKKIIGSYPFNTTAILFSIAPLINATNRMNKNEIAMKVFLTQDEKELRRILKELKACKAEQDEKLAELLPQACEQCEAQADNSVLFIYIQSEGLSGLLAQKLARIYNRPVIVCHYKHLESTLYKGSIRSPYNINFAKLINDTGLARADGHPEAAGFTMTSGNETLFKKAINKAVKEKIPSIDIRPKADVLVDLCDLGIDLCRKIADLDYISGEGFKPIRFLVKNLSIDFVDSMKDGLHLKLTSGDVDFIKWNTDVPVEEYNLDWFNGKTFDAIGTLSLGGFGTPRVQMICDEIYIDGED